ncbi:unnamed protein product [Vicia faba]|uniref:Uncharacterized protein n=1 Tax=Vicia faba TaxID=3906 RepID=A0AAV0YUJ5_VICFA|nr:unnamed protein product [Vicia faba]
MESVKYDAGMSDRSSIADVNCGQLERFVFFEYSVTRILRCCKSLYLEISSEPIGRIFSALTSSRNFWMKNKDFQCFRKRRHDSKPTYARSRPGVLDQNDLQPVVHQKILAM